MVFFSYSNNMANFEAFLPVVVGYFIVHKLIFSKYLMIIFDDFSIVNLVLATVTCHLKLKSGHISRFFTAVNIKHLQIFFAENYKILWKESPRIYIDVRIFKEEKLGTFYHSRPNAFSRESLRDYIVLHFTLKICPLYQRKSWRIKIF